MKSITPDVTIEKLGWKAARKSLKETRSITAPRPPYLSWNLARKYPSLILPWLKNWCSWPWRTVKFWIQIWKHARTDYVKEYKTLAATGMQSREIFRQTKRRMHLTEDEIFTQGNRILQGENLPALTHAKEVDVGKQLIEHTPSFCSVCGEDWAKNGATGFDCKCTRH